jgi:hypothetical protein
MSSEVVFKSVDPSQLDTLEQAFNAAWIALRPKKLRADSLQEKEQQRALANCIVAIAEDGVTDPDELRKKAIELMLIGPA